MGRASGAPKPVGNGAQHRNQFPADQPIRPYKLLNNLYLLGGKASSTRIRTFTSIKAWELRETLAWLNARGYVAGNTVTKGVRRPVTWSITVLGEDVLRSYRAGMLAVMQFNTRLVGLDRVPAFLASYPWLFAGEPSLKNRRKRPDS